MTPSPARPYRWIVLIVFILAAALSQMLWLNFAPILSLVESRYGIGESQASLLLLVFPLIYVLLAIPAGNLIDRRGYRFGVGFGVLVMAVFAVVRLFSGSFAVLLIAQIGIAVAQPFIINGITKLVADWFPSDEAALATGLGTMGMFIGMALGMGLTPPLVDHFGFEGMLTGCAALTVLGAVAFFVFTKDGPYAAEGAPAGGNPGIMALFQNRTLVLLFIVSFLGLGFFNGLTTWIEPILAPNGFNSAQAGNVGAMLIFGGIVGAALIPALSEKIGRRNPILIASILATIATLYPVCYSNHYATVLTFAALHGFFFLPAFALVIDGCAEVAGAAHAGAATGVLMLAGNLGGVLVITAMDAIRGGKPSFAPALALMFAILAVTLVLTLILPETYRRSRTSE
jgi:predicted MFS family arabinose efflux permease